MTLLHARDASCLRVAGLLQIGGRCFHSADFGLWRVTARRCAACGAARGVRLPPVPVLAPSLGLADRTANLPGNRSQGFCPRNPPARAPRLPAALLTAFRSRTRALVI
jgi:hypothetical protein